MIEVSQLTSKLNGTIFREVLMSRHTSYRIGGPARIFCVPRSVDDLRIALQYAGECELPLFIMGNGSNLLVSDQGFPGMVIKISGTFNGMTFHGSQVSAGAGTDLGLLINQAARRGLFGLPFAVGIPGTVAGAVVMNAGSSALYMGQHVEKVSVLDCLDGRIKDLSQSELLFRYRRSVLEGGRWIVLQVDLQLEEEDPILIFTRIRELLIRRKGVQPLQYSSAGSVFRNPEQAFAGKLIEEAGCKGWQVGEAMVSPIHANFIVNLGHATAGHVYELMLRVRDEVYRHFGIQLQPEVQLLGKWPQEVSADGFRRVP